MRSLPTWPAIALALTTACGDPPPPVFGTLPDFQLTDQNGAAVTKATLAGHVWAVDFVFTSCNSVCPRITQTMAEIQNDTATLKPAPWLVSISVDPHTDTPAVLKAYADEHHADPARWRFLTGDDKAVEDVVTGAFKQAMVKSDTEPGQVLHGSHIIAVDELGQIRGFFASEDPAAMAELKDTLRTLGRD